MNYFRLDQFLYFLLFLSISTISFALPEQTFDAVKTEKFNFLALADIHFDPFTGCESNKACPLIDKLRFISVEEWPKILAQYDVRLPQYKNDTNYSLLISSLKASRQVAEINHSRFVLLLGDVMGHESRSKYKRYSSDKKAADYQQFSRKILEFLTRQLAIAFPSIDVYIAVGNNDSYHGDYYIKPNGQFFNDTAILWSRLIKNHAHQLSMQKQFSYAGYYSVVLPDPDNLRLVIMNTNLFSDKVKGRNIDGAASRHLTWLHEELQMARKNHQRVFIAMHIPQGIDLHTMNHTRLFRLIRLWKPQYSSRFDAELNQFSAEVAGIFAGHLHRNWFQIISTQDNDIPVIGVTSISPIFGNNPGFTRISYFMHPIHLDDFYNYSLSVGRGVWQLSLIQKKWENGDMDNGSHS